MASVHEPDKNTSDKTKEKSALLSGAGGFVSSVDVKDDEFGSTVKSDNSHISAKFKDGSFWSFMPGRAIWKSIGDFCINVQRSFTINVRGDTQFVYGGDHHVLHNGDHSVQYGNPSPEHKAAAAKIAELSKKIQQAKIDKTEEAAKGEEAMIPCPICKGKHLEQKAYEKAKKAAGVIQHYFPKLNIPWDVIKKVIQYVIAPFLGISSLLSLNGGKGCGSPGCKNGKVVDPQHAINAGTKAGIAAYNEHKDEIEKNQKLLSEKGQSVIYHHGDTMIQVGIPGAQNKQDDHAKVGHKLIPTTLQDAQAAKSQGHFPNTKGSVENMAYIPPEVGVGSLHLNVNEQFTLSTGTPGVDIKSNGIVSVAGTKIDMTADTGELTISSKNKTTIAGGNVYIDAKNRSGDEGCHIDGNTYVQGQLSVEGDIVFKGRCHAGSSLHVPHLHIPGERMQVTPCGNENQHAGMPVHNGTVKKSANILDKLDATLKKVGRDLAWGVTGFFADLGLAAITKKVEETYGSVMMAAPIANEGMAVGFAWMLSNLDYTPIKVIGPTGTVIGTVDPSVSVNVFMYPHTHYSTVDSHQHSQLIPKATYYNTEFDMRSAAPSPSKIPLPAETNGVGSAPGPKCISACGGGGGSFGNGKSDRVNNAILQRNAGYGIQGLESFNGNYVPATAKFTPEGDITPAPDFTMLNCD